MFIIAGSMISPAILPSCFFSVASRISASLNGTGTVSSTTACG